MGTAGARARPLISAVVVWGLVCSPARDHAWAAGHVPVEPDASFRGEAERDMLWAAVYAGDVNGDGMDDLAMGAPYAGGADYAGKAYIFLGQPDRWGLNTSVSTADVTFTGEQEGDTAGMGLANGGDLDGDGFADLIVGAEFNSQGGTYAGKVYAIYGAADLEPGDHSLSDVPHSLVGEWPGDLVGMSIAGIGDVNGDGLDDLAVGSLNNVEGGKEAGQVYIVLGSAERIGESVDLGDVDASFLGRPRDWLGFRLSGKGDVNGDGLDDLSLGAPGHDVNRGRAYVAFGSHGGWEMDSYVSELEFSYQGEVDEDLGDDDDDASDDDDDDVDDDDAGDDDVGDDDDAPAADDDADEGLCCACSTEGGSVPSTPLILMSLALAVGARRRLSRGHGGMKR